MVVLAVVSSSAVVVSLASGAQAGAAAGTNRIVFASTRDVPSRAIYSMNPDGSDVVKLNNGGSEPVWSPDRSRIAYTGGSDVFVMNADGTGQSNLTHNPAFDHAPTWSPDGTRIAFASTRSDGYDIFVMNADGSDVVNLTNSDLYEDMPAWSPDGTRIAYMGAAAGASNNDVFVMNSDGSNRLDLTAGSNAHDETPAWSPDGQHIVFMSTRVVNTADLFVMNPDGSNQTDLTNSPTMQEQSPSWSPDGTQIAFEAHRDGFGQDLWIIDATGGTPSPITTSTAEDVDPDWGLFAPTADSVPPQVTGTPDRSPDSGVWYRQPVTVSWSAVDDVDGVLASPPSVVVSQDGAALVATSESVCDSAGNCATGAVLINLDQTSPVASVSGVSPGAVYPLGAVPSASCSSADPSPSSGLVTVATVSVTGGSADGTGTFVATCVGATDAAGNQSAPVSTTYFVHYVVAGGGIGGGGAGGPVDPPPFVNTGKAGRTYSAQWQLTTASGTPITNLSAISSVTYKATTCAAFTGDPTDGLEAEATGATGLRLSGSIFVFNWKTPSTPGCYTLFVNTADGAALPAYFRLT